MEYVLTAECQVSCAPSWPSPARSWPVAKRSCWSSRGHRGRRSRRRREAAGGAERCGRTWPRCSNAGARSATRRAKARSPRAARKEGSARANGSAALFDDGDFLEYGEFALAAQRRRREPDELARMSPADGLDCRHRRRERRPVRRRARALHRDGVRLYGVRRNARLREPSQDRSHAAARRTVAHPAGDVRRGRRRPARATATSPGHPVWRCRRSRATRG